jgi:hypothetical protein
MARKLRVQYPGAIYHVMNRGDRREAIFEDDADREKFIEQDWRQTVKGNEPRRNAKTAKYLIFLCVLRLLAAIELSSILRTPQYTSRFNRRHKVFGHLFSGRYKALIVDGSGNGYLRTVCQPKPVGRSNGSKARGGGRSGVQIDPPGLVFWGQEPQGRVA